VARVPVSTEFARPTQALGNERLRYAGARDFVGPAVEGFGRAIGQAAEAIDRVEAVHDEADALRLDNELRNRARARLVDGEDAYLTRRGFAAGETQAEILADLNGDAESLLGSARSERAREMARRAFQTRLATAQDQVGLHAVKEIEAARIGQANARIEGAITDAIDARGTDQFTVQLGVATQELASNATRLGWSPEQLQGETDKLISNTYSRTALAIDAEDGSPTRALEFIEANKDLIGPEEQARLTAQLAPRVDGAWAQDIVRSGGLDKYLIAAPVAETPKGEPKATKSGDLVGDGSAIIKQLFPGARITSGYRGPDHPLTKANPRSYHTTGAAVDTAAIPGMTFDEYVSQIKAAGYTVVEAINEYEKPSAHATGGHWHVVIAGQGEAGEAPGAPGVAADPRLDSRQMRDAVDKYIAENPGLSERRKQALYAAADQQVNIARADRAQAEADADRRLQDWLNNNMPGPDDLTSMSQIPAAVMAGISPNTAAAVQARIQAVQARAEARADAARQAEADALEDAAIFELYSLTDEELASTDVESRYRGRIKPSTLGPWIDRQQAAAQRASGGTGNLVTGDRIAGRIDTLGKDFGASRSLDAKPDERKLWADVRGYVEERVAGRPNKDVSDEELRALILSGLQEVTLDGTQNILGFGGATARRAQVTNQRVDIGDIPAVEVTRIREAYAQQRIFNPSTRQIFDAYQRARARGDLP
jgi:soluble lytic murein transglycosylase